MLYGDTLVLSEVRSRDIINSNAHTNGELDVVAFQKCIDPYFTLDACSVYDKTLDKYVYRQFRSCGVQMIEIVDDELMIYSFSNFPGVDYFREKLGRVLSVILGMEIIIVRYHGENYAVTDKNQIFKIHGMHSIKINNIMEYLQNVRITNYGVVMEIINRRNKILNTSQASTTTTKSTTAVKKPRLPRKTEW